MALEFQLPPKGFQSYLDGILPLDQAVVAGAFSVSMQQVRNIGQVDLQSWSQVVASLETNYGLTLTNGTDVPTDGFIANQALRKTALGSGPYGTYTMSDAIGAMSGLPYPYEQIYNGIKELETTKLTNIYQELYLAVKWEQASPTVTVTKTTYAVQNGDTGSPDFDPLYDYYYTITNATWAGFAGGGYGRGTAPAPTGIITGGSGATVTTTIETDPNNVPGGYGQVLTVTLNSAGSPVLYSSGNLSPTPSSPPATPVELQAPPTATLAVQVNGSKATGGTNTAYGTAGWSGMNTVVDAYVTQSQDEIEDIQNFSDGNFEKANVLNTNWNITGTALKIEQRCRYIAIPPVAAPYDRFLSNYPQALYVFTDTIPEIAQDTKPHGGAQTMENIVDYCSVGGQSLVNMMRQERNQARLKEVGIELDNNIPNTLEDELEKLLISNGTVPLAVDGVPSPAGIFTLPAFSKTEECENPDGGEDVGPGGGEEIAPIPTNYFDPNLPGLRTTTEPGLTPEVIPGGIEPILEAEYLGPFDDGLGGPGLNSDIPAGLPITNPVDTVVVISNVPPVGTGDPVIGTNIQGPDGPLDTNLDDPLTGITLPPNTNLYPNPISPVLDPNLDNKFTNSTLLPSSYPIADAIDKVIECNCDCWVM